MVAQAEADIREYAAQARSTDTFGRVMCNARNHYFVIDGPVQNGCPGEEVTPGEMFLAAVASCGIELVQVIARQQDLPVQTITASIKGVMDRNNPVRPDYTVFQTVQMEFHIKGVTEEQGAQLVEAFTRR
jgi:uncharacterized OsmC-like protein